MRVVLISIGIVVAVAILGFFGLLGYLTITDYQPEEQEIVFTSEESTVVSTSSELSFLIWNIGYCGLNREMDFFYDGGKMVRPRETQVLKNLNGIRDFLSNRATKYRLDFILLQEVDEVSRRSYYLNEKDTISTNLSEYNTQFAYNYKVAFIPQPTFNPMGKVASGLLTASRYTPSEAVRYSFPGNFSYPLRLAMLDRCFLVNSYPTADGKKLLVINTHNSAYDDGSLREKQMEHLQKFIKRAYERGDYVVVGGDWNQCPPKFTAQFTKDIMDNISRKDVPSNFLSSWKWVFDNTRPTNRRVATPYQKGETLTTVIDYFLLSPNIELKEVENIDMGFEYSDHQPVSMRVILHEN